jgi:hypothetical protein
MEPITLFARIAGPAHYQGEVGDQDEEAASLVGLERLLEEGLPVDRSVPFRRYLVLRPFEDPLRIRRRHKAAEGALALVAAEALHLLIHSLADQFAGGVALLSDGGRRVQG